MSGDHVGSLLLVVCLVAVFFLLSFVVGGALFLFVVVRSCSSLASLVCLVVIVCLVCVGCFLCVAECVRWLLVVVCCRLLFSLCAVCVYVDCLLLIGARCLLLVV